MPEMWRSRAPGRLTPLATARNTLTVQRQPRTSSSSVSTRLELSLGMMPKSFFSCGSINLHQLVRIPFDCACCCTHSDREIVYASVAARGEKRGYQFDRQ